MKKLFIFLGSLLGLVLISLGGCRNDIVPSGNVGSQPSFSTDTVRLDTLFSRISSSTARMMVYNKHTEPIELESVYLQSNGRSGYRINVDGRSGVVAENILILPKDSMYVFVEATFPEGADDLPTLVEDSIVFRCNGVSSHVLLHAWRQNVTELSVLDVKVDTTITDTRPMIINDSIVVHEGATLRLEAGARILMHSEAKFSVYGRIESRGTSAKRVRIESQRQDKIDNSSDPLIPNTDIPYPLVPGQWSGIRFGANSFGNILEYTTIRSADDGLLFAPSDRYTEDRAELTGCIITNMKGVGLKATGGAFRLTNCELSNTHGTTLDLRATKAKLTYCSIVNFYAWSIKGPEPRGVALEFRDFVPTEIDSNAGGIPIETSYLELLNCIVDGDRALNSGPKDKLGAMFLILADPESTSLANRVNFTSCYIRTLPTPDMPAIDCIYPDVDEKIDKGEERHYARMGYKLEIPYNEKNYVYDFHPLDTAPFIGKARPLSLVTTDLEGLPRSVEPTAGCYEPVENPTPQD